MRMDGPDTQFLRDFEGLHPYVAGWIDALRAIYATGIAFGPMEWPTIPDEFRGEMPGYRAGLIAARGLITGGQRVSTPDRSYYAMLDRIDKAISDSLRKGQ